MAASAGQLHKLVGKNLKMFKQAWKHVSQAVSAARQGGREAWKLQLQTVAVRTAGGHGAAQRLQALRQRQTRWYTTYNRSAGRASRSGSSGSSGSGGSGGSGGGDGCVSRVERAMRASTGRAMFASALRPNVTGGTLVRSAGGYTLGGVRAARHFSHLPAAPGEVVHNVSQAMRSFLLAGKRAQFDGVDPATRQARFRTVTALQAETGRRLRSLPHTAPGSRLAFTLSPAVTAIARPGGGGDGGDGGGDATTLHADGLLHGLAGDFARSARELAAVLADLQRLSALGDLPITRHGAEIRVHFPGCDAATVDALCADADVSRGLVRQDDDFDARVGARVGAGADTALRFPLAPTDEPGSHPTSPHRSPARWRAGHRASPRVSRDQIDWAHMMPLSAGTASAGRTRHLSTLSMTGSACDPAQSQTLSSLQSPSASHSIPTSQLDDGRLSSRQRNPSCPTATAAADDYQGFEGICKFIAMCDASAR